MFPDACVDRHCSYNVSVSELRFEWDPKKDRANQRKHGISFDEAKTAFSDEQGLLLDDPDHSEDEERFVLLGMSATLRILVVCHCYRGGGDVIRIISARKAVQQEQEQYSNR